MATRKELLEDLTEEVGRLSSAVADNTWDLSSSNAAAAGRVEDALRRHGHDQRASSESLARGIEQAGGSLVAAAVVFAVGGVVNTIVAGVVRAIEGVIEEIVYRIREEGERSQMINSIRALQESYPRMSYTFLVKRTFVSRTGRRQRETILNGLICDGIVTTNFDQNNAEWFSVEDDNPALIEHWERLEEMQESIQEMASAFSKASSRYV